MNTDQDASIAIYNVGDDHTGDSEVREKQSFETQSADSINGDSREQGTTELVPASSVPLATPFFYSSPAPDRHPVAVYLARLAPGSRRTMRQALTTIADILSSGRMNLQTLPWHQVRYQHTAALRAHLVDAFAPATTNKMLAALRGVLKEAWRLEQMSAEDYHRAADVETVSSSSLPRGQALSAGELRALLSACAADKSIAGRRDGALVAALYGAGLRRSEVVALTVEDYTPETGALIVRSGKGRKDRICYAPSGSREAIAAWMQQRGPAEGALFVPINKGKKMTIRQMTDQAVLSILRKRAREAATNPFSPHDLRRSFISDLLDAGADIATVQKMAGHASVQTTARYDRRGEAVKKRAADLLHVPYEGE